MLGQRLIRSELPMSTGHQSQGLHVLVDWQEVTPRHAGSTSALKLNEFKGTSYSCS